MGLAALAVLEVVIHACSGARDTHKSCRHRLQRHLLYFGYFNHFLYFGPFGEAFISGSWSFHSVRALRSFRSSYLLLVRVSSYVTHNPLRPQSYTYAHTTTWFKAIQATVDIHFLPFLFSFFPDRNPLQPPHNNFLKKPPHYRTNIRRGTSMISRAKKLFVNT